MRILHLLGPMSLPRDPDREAASGVVRAALEIARAQAKLGHEVWVAAVGREAWEAEWLGVKLAQLRYAAWARGTFGGRTLDFRAHLPYMTLTRKYRFDIVQGHLYVYLRFLRAKVRIAHFHSDPFYRGTASQSIALSAADFCLIERSTQAQVAVSRFVAEQLRQGLGSRGNVHVVHNGVNNEHFDPDYQRQGRQRLRSQWGVKEGSKVFLYAGAIVPEKGVLHLAQAFARLSQQMHHVHLAVAGNSRLWHGTLTASDPKLRYEDEVRRVLDTACRQGKVHFLGKVGPAEMPGVYGASDVVVIPSVCREAFPLVALEALAAGRPVIASAVGGLPELVNVANGILIEPGDEAGLESAMRAMIGDAGLRQRLGLAGREHARRFSWEKAVQALETIYASNL